MNYFAGKHLNHQLANVVPVWLPTCLRQVTNGKEKIKKETKEMPKMAKESDSVCQYLPGSQPEEPK